MSVEDLRTVDMISEDNSGAIVLSIIDDLEWDESHLIRLQDKIIFYMAFVDSGQLSSTYPVDNGKEIIIKVMCKHAPTGEAAHFLSRCFEFVKEAGYRFRYEVEI